MTETEALGFTTEEAAAMLHISAYTLREKVRDHKIGARKYAGRLWFTQDNIDEYLRKNLQVLTPQGNKSESPDATPDELANDQPTQRQEGTQ